MNKNKTILQVPIDKKIRDAALIAVRDLGFSSLQEGVRVYLIKLSRKQITFNLEENTEYLTPKQDEILEKKYRLFLKDKKQGKTFTAKSAKEIMKQLTS